MFQGYGECCIHGFSTIEKLVLYLPDVVFSTFAPRWRHIWATCDPWATIWMGKYFFNGFFIDIQYRHLVLVSYHAITKTLGHVRAHKIISPTFHKIRIYIYSRVSSSHSVLLVPCIVVCRQTINSSTFMHLPRHPIHLTRQPYFPDTPMASFPSGNSIQSSPPPPPFTMTSPTILTLLTCFTTTFPPVISASLITTGSNLHLNTSTKPGAPEPFSPLSGFVTVVNKIFFFHN